MGIVRTEPFLNTNSLDYSYPKHHCWKNIYYKARKVVLRVIDCSCYCVYDAELPDGGVVTLIRRFIPSNAPLRKFGMW